MIVDTHCHLDDSRYDEDLDMVIARAKVQGVGKFIIPAADPKTLKKAVALSEKYNDIYFSVGTHPYDAKNYDEVLLREFIEHPKCVAVGECGLDYYRLPKDDDMIVKEKRLQKEVFICQIRLANEFDLPLIVHIRESSNDCLEILEEFTGKRGGVLHCYNADNALLRLTKRGFCYGIGGVLTFSNARKLVEIYPKIPLDNLLIETDAPYLTPHPHRGERNEPSYCALVAKKMAELSGISVEEISQITTTNAKRLFSL